MALFLILSPFAVLSAMLSIAPPAAALFTTASLALGLLIADRVRGRSLKLLQAATFTLTAALGCCALVFDQHVTSGMARLSLDAGLLLVMLASLAWRAPFTIQYAREKVEPETAARPEFFRANVVMSAVWIIAMVLMLIGELSAHVVPWLPLWTGLAVAFAVRNAAVWFTRWYSARSRAKGEATRASVALAARTSGGTA